MKKVISNVVSAIDKLSFALKLVGVVSRSLEFFKVEYEKEFGEKLETKE